MSALDLTKYKVLTFDCYGTLIDWETGIKRVIIYDIFLNLICYIIQELLNDLLLPHITNTVLSLLIHSSQAFLDLGFLESELNTVLEKFGQVETVHQQQKPTALYQQILADVIREIGALFNKVKHSK